MGKLVSRANRQKIGATKKVQWVQRIVRYSTLKESDVISYIASEVNIPKSLVKRAMGALSQTMANYVLNGHRVAVADVGYFGIGCNAKAAETLEEVSLDKISRVKFTFLPDVATRSEVDNVSITLSKPSSTL